MRPVDTLTVGYLVLAPVALLGPGRPAVWPALLAAHGLAVAGIVLTARRRAAERAVRGAAAGVGRGLWLWYPLLLMPFLYAELPLLSQSLGSGYHDGAIIAVEGALFGTQPAQTLAGALPYLLLSELLHLGYISYYVLIYGPPLVLFLQRREGAFTEMVFYEMLTFYVCYLIFVFFPVQGPRYLWPAPPGVPDGPVRSLALLVLEAGSSRGAAFPSSHVAVAVMQALLARRLLPRLAPLVAVLAVLLGLGAVYGGFHYAADVVAGAALAPGLFAVARWVYGRRQGGEGEGGGTVGAGRHGRR